MVYFRTFHDPWGYTDIIRIKGQTYSKYMKRLSKLIAWFTFTRDKIAEKCETVLSPDTMNWNSHEQSDDDEATSELANVAVVTSSPTNTFNTPKKKFARNAKSGEESKNGYMEKMGRIEHSKAFYSNKCIIGL